MWDSLLWVPAPIMAGRAVTEMLKSLMKVVCACVLESLSY